MDDEMKQILQTSKKIENASKKEGLREGISAGRDSNFQESFDRGFEEGFKNGFLLGKYKGILIAESKLMASDEKTHGLLENISLGSCEICKNQDSLIDEENIDNLTEIQIKSFNKNVQTLISNFGENILSDIKK
ncbi:uncharacterized protein LOC130446084 [Diorhabda sublineata]|uniref:uncharacterized protein LOC130446084 n=1 Tax=Diorhabda sublineata TaxID=1163346 RepID=UPI0024E0B58D|nr:uncharacterized protein LOC130446084 [Diorhabda sublineata]